MVLESNQEKWCEERMTTGDIDYDNVLLTVI